MGHHHRLAHFLFADGLKRESENIMNKKVLIGIIAGVVAISAIVGGVFLLRHKHTEVVDVKVAPTCTSTGLTAGKHCSECGEVLVAQEVVPATGHIEVIDERVNPTCTSTGLSEGSHCSRCNEILIAQEIIKKLPHTENIDSAVAATCLTDGKTEGKHCSVCETIIVAQETVKATGHTEVIDVAIAPTYVSRGKTEGSHCSVCNTVLIEQRDIATVWAGEAIQPTKLIQIDGKYYYEINSAEELAYLTNAPKEWKSYNFILNCDIFLNSDLLEFDSEGNLLNNIENLKEWSGFSCINFNGNNHTISGIYSISGGGFISHCDSIYDINIKNSYIYTNKTGNIGGVCNSVYNNITNCSFYGVVIGVGKMGVGTSSGSVDSGVGGIAGSHSIYGSIINCNNYGIVKGTYGVGGIVGTASDIINCCNYGNVIGIEKVGGICGFNDFGGDGVKSSTNYGTVQGHSDVGGIIGMAARSSSVGSENSNNYGSVLGEDYVGGIIGHIKSGRIYECNNYASVSGVNYVGGVVGYNGNAKMNSCNTIAIVNGTDNVGAIVGFLNVFSDDACVTKCYYLKNSLNNATLTGISNLDDQTGGCEAKDENFFVNFN